jgi:hypothetical protein
MNQKEAVFKAVTTVKDETSFDGAVTLSRDEREKVSKIVADYFTKGEVSFSDGKREGKELSTYVSGLISNWLRKDDRLNGHTKYVPKNPGSRTGNGDEMLKAMRTLLTTVTDPKIQDEIQSAIDKRVDELKPKKVVNLDNLPDHLKKYVQQ